MQYDLEQPRFATCGGEAMEQKLARSMRRKSGSGAPFGRWRRAAAAALSSTKGEEVGDDEEPAASSFSAVHYRRATSVGDDATRS